MNPNTRHYVYRCYDADERLLYIGCTHDIGTRFAVHQSSWSNPVSAVLNLRMVRHTEAEYPNKAAARRAEREVLVDERVAQPAGRDTFGGLRVRHERDDRSARPRQPPLDG